MTMIDTKAGRLSARMVDLTPPWVADPETVILHHGVGTSAMMWSEWLPHLIARFRVVLFDMRGCGESPLPDDGFEWTIDSFASDVMAVADTFEVERFHLIGESFGGTVALHALAHHGRRLISVTTVSAPHRGDAIRAVDSWKEYAGSAAGMARWSDELMAWRFAPGAVDPAALAWFTEEQTRSPREIVARVPLIVQATDLTVALRDVKTPVLLLCGDSSPLVEVGLVAELHQILSNSEIQVFAGTRHGLAFSRPRECAEVFASFCSRWSTGGAG